MNFLDHLNKIQPKNFAKASLILKNSKIFQKPQKLGQKRWNAWLNERNRIIPEEENDLEAKDWVGKRFRVREGCLGRWGVRKNRKSSRKMRDKLRWSFILKSTILNGSRDIERYREVSRFKFRQIELSRGVYSKVTSMDQEAIQQLSRRQKLSWWIKKLSKSYRG